MFDNVKKNFIFVTVRAFKIRFNLLLVNRVQGQFWEIITWGLSGLYKKDWGQYSSSTVPSQWVLTRSLLCGCALVKTDPEFQWNPAGIPGRCRADSAGIPLESAGIIAGIPPVFPWNSSRNSAGIIAGIPLVFHWNSSRNSARIIAGIPPEFRWNYCRHTAGISDNSSWNSTGIPDPNTAGIPELG